LLLIKPGKEKAWCEKRCWLMRSWRLLKKLVIAGKLLRDDLLAVGDAFEAGLFVRELS